MRVLEQRFRRNAAPDQAGAAQRLLFLDDCDAQAELRAADGGDVPARSRADHDEIVLVGHTCLLSGWRTRSASVSVSGRTGGQRRSRPGPGRRREPDRTGRPRAGPRAPAPGPAHTEDPNRLPASGRDAWTIAGRARPPRGPPAAPRRRSTREASTGHLIRRVAKVSRQPALKSLNSPCR